MVNRIVVAHKINCVEKQCVKLFILLGYKTGGGSLIVRLNRKFCNAGAY